MAHPEVEVLAKAQRRRFTKEYKRQVLADADRCRKPGEIGALLRREGLYASHLAGWRAARDRGDLSGKGQRKRGPKAKVSDASLQRIAALEREKRQLLRKLQRAEAMLELQKKAAALLSLADPSDDEQRMLSRTHAGLDRPLLGFLTACHTADEHQNESRRQRRCCHAFHVFGAGASHRLIHCLPHP
jgi:transposase-like protein